MQEYIRYEKYAAFVVTRVGQIRNVQNYIRQFHPHHNVLIMMFTPDDSSLLINMQNACQADLFTEILYLKLPKKPVRLTRSKAKCIYEDMKMVLKRLKKVYDIRELFLCNINNYYVYFERINEAERLNIRLNLLEEGLTTYKIVSENAFDRLERKVNFNDVKKSAKFVMKSIKTFLKSFGKIFVNLGIFGLQILSLICRKNLVDRCMRLVTAITVNKKYRYDYIRKVEQAYLCFPDMARESELKIGEIRRLPFLFSELRDPTVLGQLEGYSNLFINQKYVNYNSHFRVMFQIFREMGLENVLIKLHPKEKLSDMTEVLEALKNQYPEINVKVLGDIGQIPVEDLVKAAGLKQVIGLTSSSLIYLQEYLPEVKNISVAERYRFLCEEQEHVPMRELAQFDDEYRFFDRFEGIQQFRCGGRI